MGIKMIVHNHRGMYGQKDKRREMEKTNQRSVSIVCTTQSIFVYFMTFTEQILLLLSLLWDAVVWL